MLVSSLSPKWGQHRLAAKVRSVGPTGIRERGKGTGWIAQEPGRSCVRPTESSRGTGLERDQALRRSPPQGSERGDGQLERGSESISDPVFGAGSRSALIVLLTLGNAAQADPVEGSGAPYVQNRS